MPKNELGNYVRERRMELGLTQEELANRIGGSASQAEISRLERGSIMLPRRNRLEALATALDVTLGALLMHSGWMTNDEGVLVDRLPIMQSQQSQLDPITAQAMVDEVVDLRETLLAAIERVNTLELTLKNADISSPRSEVNLRAGVFDDWESSAIFEG